MNTHHKDEVKDEDEILDESRAARQHFWAVCFCSETVCWTQRISGLLWPLSKVQHHTRAAAYNGSALAGVSIAFCLVTGLTHRRQAAFSNGTT